MATLVEIESETLNLVFKLLESDVGVLKMAVAKSWESGALHYKKRIKSTFSDLDKVESMIDSITSTFSKDIDDIKQDVITMAAPDGDDGITEIKKKLINTKSRLRRKLSHLKGLSWERDMRVAGYKEFEVAPNEKDTATKRDNDGKFYVHDLDENTVQVYDD